MGTPLLLGLDAGTGSVKGVLADVSGRAHHASSGYEFVRPCEGAAEQDPADWWNAATRVIRALLEAVPDARDRIAGVSLSGQGAAAVLLDRNREVVRPALLWLDTRPAPQAKRLAETVGGRVAEIGGKAPAAYNVEPKLLWLAEREPERFLRAWKVLTTTAYLTFRMTGRLVMNRSDAGILLAYDLRRNAWSEEALRLMGLSADLFCEIAPCAGIIGHVSSEAARQTGLAEGVPVVAGGEDTSCAGLAAGATEPGIGLLSLGTASTAYLPTAELALDPRLLVFPHVLEGQILIGGSTVAGGAALHWAAKATGFEGASDAAFTREAQKSQPGAGGLIFLPYLAGELQPINNGYARGVFFGASLATARADLVRAVFEGSAFAVAHALSIARSLGHPLRELRAVGAPSGNSFFGQILADVIGVPVRTMRGGSGAALGDAALAALGTGVVTETSTMVAAHSGVERTFEPSSDTHRFYGEVFQTYLELYPRLEDLFPRRQVWMESRRTVVSVH
ncbi:MAG: hypothetical protein IT160_06195 [Bryobacterales bacterium]|nr:hypothetical protein [Bryobacterales bacterium]